jgi:hypothetical protein
MSGFRVYQKLVCCDRGEIEGALRENSPQRSSLTLAERLESASSLPVSPLAHSRRVLSSSLQSSYLFIKSPMCSRSHGAVICVTVHREPPAVSKITDHCFPTFDVENIDERDSL